MIEELIKGIIGSKGGEWIAVLTEKFGFSSGQAESFLPAALKKVVDAVQGGKIDLAGGIDLSNLGEAAQEIVSNIDVDGIASEAGVDREKAESGLKALLPDFGSALAEKAGGLEKLTGLLGGGGEGLVGKIGKMFG